MVGMVLTSKPKENMRKHLRKLSRVVVVAGAAAGAASSQAQLAALTNNLASIQATTANINSAGDTGLTIGLGWVTVGFIVGALGYGLKIAFKKRPT
jgi:hypothetical protein